MTRIATLIISALFFISCGSGVKLKKSQVKYFDSGFSAIIENMTFEQSGEGFKDFTFLDLFYIKAANIDSIRINFTRDDELIVSYSDSGKINEKTFKGQFMKRGYYEFYFTNRKLDIPPLIPFLLTKHEINRVRLALTVVGEFVVDRKWDNTGSILLILGAGSLRRQQSLFEIRIVEPVKENNTAPNAR